MHSQWAFIPNNILSGCLAVCMLFMHKVAQYVVYHVSS